MSSSTQETHETNTVTFWQACKFGDTETVQNFLQEDSSLLQQPDEEGYYALQWAALHNKVGVVQLLLEAGAEVNQQDNFGQTALHWSAVKGSVPCCELLIRHNARLDIIDTRGYTVQHIAAQYGQPSIIYMLHLKYSVDIDVADARGLTPLHWAAHKGYADTVRLLLFLDSSLVATDCEKLTPLHWGAAQGNGDVCKMIVQAGGWVCLGMQDSHSATPGDLARSRGHRLLAFHIEHYKHRGQKTPAWKKGVLKGLLNTSLCPFIWALIIGLVYSFVAFVMRGPQAAHITPLMRVTEVLVIVLALISLVFLYRTTTADPGFILPSPTPSTKHAHKPAPHDEESGALIPDASHKIDSPILWAGEWSRVCVTCRIIRPLRAKHDQVTNKCVEVFDHYCPWVGNAVGKGNRHHFVTFLSFALTAQVLSFIITMIRMQSVMSNPSTKHSHQQVLGDEVGWILGTGVWLAADFLVGVSVGVLCGSQVSQLCRNVTTNELINWHRYKYLKSEDGSFSNPFDNGCKANCLEACRPEQVAMAPMEL